MKKIFLATILIAFFCAACTPEFTDPVTLRLSDSQVDEYCHSASSNTVVVELSNTTNRAVDLEWKHSDEEAGWSYMVNGSAANLGGIITMEAKSTERFSLTITPNGNIDKVTGVIEFYDVENTAAALQTCSYSLTSFASYFKIRPQGAMSGSTSLTFNPVINYSITMINENNAPIDVQWERISESAQSPWSISTTVNWYCYPSFTMANEVTIPANDSVEFQLNIDERSTAGYGQSTATFWVEDDRLNSIKRQLIEHTVAP
jgi:hypothetical protein